MTNKIYKSEISVFPYWGDEDHAFEKEVYVVAENVEEAKKLLDIKALELLEKLNENNPRYGPNNPDDCRSGIPREFSIPGWEISLEKIVQ